MRNIVAGAFYSGYGLPGVNCRIGNPSGVVIENNVAHSNNGEGAIFYPNAADATQGSNHEESCFVAHKFVAYKNTGHGAITYAAIKKIEFRNMVLIDNHIGTQMMIG